jgi:hypothetical protein
LLQVNMRKEGLGEAMGPPQGTLCRLASQTPKKEAYRIPMR